MNGNFRLGARPEQGPAGLVAELLRQYDGGTQFSFLHLLQRGILAERLHAQGRIGAESRNDLPGNYAVILIDDGDRHPRRRLVAAAEQGTEESGNGNWRRQGNDQRTAVGKVQREVLADQREESILHDQASRSWRPVRLRNRVSRLARPELMWLTAWPRVDNHDRTVEADAASESTPTVNRPFC